MVEPHCSNFRIIAASFLVSQYLGNLRCFSRMSCKFNKFYSRFLQAGGSPEKVVELLSDNYMAVAQTVNLLAEWMIQAGVDIKDVQEMVENHLKEMIFKTFDPKKADSIFSDEGEVQMSRLMTKPTK